MNKNGMVWWKIVGAVLAITALILLIIILQRSTVWFGEQTGRIKGGIADQIAGIKHIWHFGVGEQSIPIKKAEACEELSDKVIDTMKEKYIPLYMKWLFCRAEEWDYEKDKDYAAALVKFQDYVENCADAKLSEGCERQVKLPKAENYIKKLEIWKEANNDYNSIMKTTDETERVEKLEEFIEIYRIKDFPGKDELISKAEKESRRYIGGIAPSLREKSKEDLTKEEAIILLKKMNSERKKVNPSYPEIREIINQLYNIGIYLSFPQLDQEINFMEFLLYVERGSCLQAELFLPNIENFSPKIEKLMYITYSYPRPDNQPVMKSDWIEDGVVNEAKLVLGWCYLEKGEFEKAYRIAVDLELVDPKPQTSSRYKLYKESMLGVSKPVVPCGERLEMVCSRLGPVEYGNLKFDVEKKEVGKYPHLGCWMHHSLLTSSCVSCIELKDSCGNYKTQGIGRMWIDQCNENPCGINLPSGCEVEGTIFANCIEKG